MKIMISPSLWPLDKKKEEAAMSSQAPRKRYREEDLAEALEEHERGGAKVTQLSNKYGIPERTLWWKIAKRKADRAPMRPWPAPALGSESEEDIFQWALAMQRKGYPADKETLISKGKEIAAVMFGKTRGAGTVGRGWCDRFLRRHPQLTTRSAQTGAGAQSIYNMDETSFERNVKTRKVIARRGSRNVWSRSVDANFDLTLVACGSASGELLPPLFIVPGKRLNRDVLAAADFPGARVTTADAGFMTTAIMREWLVAFAADVPTPVRRPLILVLDGASFHMDESIDIVAEQVGVRIVQLPPNSSHLYQPLDVAVFRGVKQALKTEISNFLVGSGQTTMKKRDAVRVAVSAWIVGAVQRPSNIVASFQAAGIWPLSLPAMSKRLTSFQRNGTSVDSPSPAWLVCRQTIHTEILVLPPETEKKQRRGKTVDVKRRLLTHDDLQRD
ncbi:hypothetical protein PybrP1_006066 [[Pythium] brassicae (nom. inval.)]|nr:hypothetical protein PybrP1_006066 [[Pythium] brassicae (nom. inval.)]